MGPFKREGNRFCSPGLVGLRFKSPTSGRPSHPGSLRAALKRSQPTRQATLPEGHNSLPSPFPSSARPSLPTSCPWSWLVALVAEDL